MNKEKLRIVYLSKEYQAYIKPFCSEHQLLDKGERKRPFLGTVLTGFNGYDYFVPITSSERSPRQNKQIDIFAINRGKNGTLNFNLMIPVPKGEVINFDINGLPKCPSRDMFIAQQRHIARQNVNIKKNAAEVYLRSIYSPHNDLAKRCNDFVLLEEKCKEWDNYKKEKKNASIKTDEKQKGKKDTPSADEYKKTSIYQQAVEKYGPKAADKMVSDLLKKALTQEKNEDNKEDKKTDSKQSTPTAATSKKTTKEVSSTAKKKSTSAEKSTVTTVTIKSSQKGK